MENLFCAASRFSVLSEKFTFTPEETDQRKGHSEKDVPSVGPRREEGEGRWRKAEKSEEGQKVVSIGLELIIGYLLLSDVSNLVNLQSDYFREFWPLLPFCFMNVKQLRYSFHVVIDLHRF